MYKKIGIISREQIQAKSKYKAFNSEIVDIIQKYNCIPIGIIVNFDTNPDLEFDKIKKIIDFCDAIILQGGSNLYAIDQKIVKYLYDRDIPTLGICLGMQTMAVTLGGNLQVLPKLNHDQTDHYVHPINILKDTLLYHIMKENQIIVNSRHKEAIVNTSLLVGAYSDDYVIEEVEDPTKRFFLGVQWHPESIPNDKNSLKLFDYFFKI